MLWGLSDKEKATLRLIVRGHDAKSIARTLDLSVHTINERLRDARRKMAVSSSREAARLLLEAEEQGRRQCTPENLGDSLLGADAPAAAVDQGRRRVHRRTVTIGVLVMTLTLGLLTLTGLLQAPSAPPPAHTTMQTAPDPAIAAAALQWLSLLDEGRWDESYRATGTAFRKLNTLQMWASASRRVRAPLGAALSRTLIAQDDVPAPPAGYQVLKFRTRYANGSDAVETVSLEREEGQWRVVGVTVI